MNVTFSRRRSVRSWQCMYLQQLVYQRRRFATINQLKIIFYVITEVILFSFVDFKTLDISQGTVATHLRCDEIFSDSIITIFSWFW